MRLGLITHNYPFKKGEGQATAGLFVPSFARALKNAGSDVFIFTSQRAGRVGESDLEVEWFPWKGDKALRHLNILNPRDIRFLLQYLHNGREGIIDYIQDNHIEHCLAFWAFPAGYFAWVANKKLGIPYSVWALGSDIWTYSRWPLARGLIKKVLTRADYIYADGLKLAEEVRNLAGRPCAFLPSTRDLPVPAEQLDLKKGKIKFLYIGRFDMIKGVDILFEAVRRLRQRTRDFHLFAFGEGSLYDRIKARIGQWSLDDEVSLSGYINAEEAAKFLYNCDALIISSRQESIPLIYSDGLKTGINMITSDAGDLGRLAREYRYGRIFPAGEAGALEETLFSFIRERQAGGEKEKPPKELLDLFDQKRIVSQFLKAWIGNRGL